MRTRGTEIITIEGLAEIEQARNDANHTDWERYTPAAEVLKKGLSLGRVAVIALRGAKTYEEYVTGRKLARMALDQLKQSVRQARAISPIVSPAPAPAPTAIGAPQEKALFHEHANYGGACLVLDPGDYPSLKSIHSDGRYWNDCISFSKVPDGWTAQIFTDNDFKGRSITIWGEDSDWSKSPELKDFNDKVSSIRVFASATALFCEHAGLSGRGLRLLPGEYPDLREFDFNDLISSHSLPAGWVADIFGDAYFRGTALTITGEIRDWSKYPELQPFNDEVSSIKVYSQAPSTTLEERIKDAASTAAGAVIDSAKASPEVQRNTINDMVLKVANMTGKVNELKAERNSTAAVWEEIRALEPRLKDPALKADIARLKDELTKLDNETSAKLKESNKIITDSNEAVGAYNKGEIEGIGSPGIWFIPMIVGVGVAAAAFVAVLVGLITSWLKAKENAKALCERAKADAKLADAERARLEQNEKIRDLAVDESELLRIDAAGLREQANKLAAEGRTEEANALLREALGKEAQAIKIIEPHLVPQKPLELPAAIIPTEVKVEEKTALEKFLGVKPQWIGIGAIAFIGIMLLPHIVSAVRAITPKKE